MNAQTFNKWINGAFEALEKKYVNLSNLLAIHLTIINFFC